MTDNFNLIKELIKKTKNLPQSNKNGNADIFYSIECIRRGKDNENLPAANYKFKTYYIYCWDDYDRYEDEIKSICNLLNMRAYISINYKSTKQITLNTISTLAQRIAMGDFKKIFKTFESQTSSYVPKDYKLWLLDIDNVDLKNEKHIVFIEEIKNIIKKCNSKYENPYIFTIPTKTGIHLIYHPFNIYEFNKYCEEMNFEKIDIKKNHITLLYENIK